ncbi:MAG: hypothetical protein ACYCQJ_13280 [Nitrososphaerales archaeon]
MDLFKVFVLRTFLEGSIIPGHGPLDARIVYAHYLNVNKLPLEYDVFLSVLRKQFSLSATEETWPGYTIREELIDF